MFHCKDCHCFFKKKQGYEYHLISQKHNTRISKDKINLHSCSICQQTFSHLSGLSRHRAKCKDVKELPKIDILEKEVKELHQQNLELSKKDTTNINTQNNTNVENQNNQTNNNIIINCFGRENLDYITDKVIIHCMQHIYGSLPLLIEKIPFDPDHPENHNIKIPNKKLPHAKIMNHKREWQIVNKKEAIDDMINIGYSMLDDTFQEKGHELPDAKQKHFRNFQEKYEDDDKKTKKGIRNQVENVIIDKTRK